MPRDDKPCARSLKTFAPPMDSSRSFGPEPCTSTNAGNGPSPFGMVSVAGSFHLSSPIVRSTPVNESGLLYSGDFHSTAAALTAGRK